MILFMEIKDVDHVGAKPAQTGFGCWKARPSTVILTSARRVGQFRRQNPPGLLCRDGASHDFLRTTVIIASAPSIKLIPPASRALAIIVAPAHQWFRLRRSIMVPKQSGDLERRRTTVIHVVSPSASFLPQMYAEVSVSRINK
jgi:hypothetical protein